MDPLISPFLPMDFLCTYPMLLRVFSCTTGATNPLESSLVLRTVRHSSLYCSYSLLICCSSLVLLLCHVTAQGVSASYDGLSVYATVHAFNMIKHFTRLSDGSLIFLANYVTDMFREFTRLLSSFILLGDSYLSPYSMGRWGFFR
jgi:hypothetical protein